MGSVGERSLRLWAGGNGRFCHTPKRTSLHPICWEPAPIASDLARPRPKHPRWKQRRNPVLRRRAPRPGPRHISRFVSAVAVGRNCKQHTGRIMNWSCACSDVSRAAKIGFTALGKVSDNTLWALACARQLLHLVAYCDGGAPEGDAERRPCNPKTPRPQRMQIRPRFGKAFFQRLSLRQRAFLRGVRFYRNHMGRCRADEFCIGGGMCNRGAPVSKEEQQWYQSVVSPDGNGQALDFYIRPVDGRTLRTLGEFIFACLRRSCGGYRLLVGLSTARRVLPRGIAHHRVNHSVEFVSADGHHTNVVECMRHQVRDVFEWLGRGDARIFRVMAACVVNACNA